MNTCRVWLSCISCSPAAAFSVRFCWLSHFVHMFLLLLLLGFSQGLLDDARAAGPDPGPANAMEMGVTTTWDADPAALDFGTGQPIWMGATEPAHGINAGVVFSDMGGDGLWAWVGLTEGDQAELQAKYGGWPVTPL